MQILEQPSRNSLSSFVDEITHYELSVLYELGKKWINAKSQHLKQINIENNLKKFNLAMRLQYAESRWNSSILSSFGKLSIHLDASNEKFIFVNVIEPRLGHGFRETNAFKCPIIAGILSGYFSYFLGKDFSGIETQCHEENKNACRFLIGLSQEVNAQKFWQELDNLYTNNL